MAHVAPVLLLFYQEQLRRIEPGVVWNNAQDSAEQLFRSVFGSTA